MVMKAAVPQVAAPAPEKAAAAPAAEQKAPTRLTLPVILAINVVLLATLGLILYFAFRHPPAAVPALPGAASAGDSAGRAGADSAARRSDSAAPR